MWRKTNINANYVARSWKHGKVFKSGYGPVCEKKYLEDIYKNQQVTTEDIILRKKEER